MPPTDLLPVMNSEKQRYTHRWLLTRLEWNDETESCCHVGQLLHNFDAWTSCCRFNVSVMRRSNRHGRILYCISRLEHRRHCWDSTVSEFGAL